MERETLAIVFGCSKFHEYIYGRRFLVESDHKALKSILNNPLHKAPPRIQSFMLYLQKYDFEINYITGKSEDMTCTDTLSRAALHKDTKVELTDVDIKSQVHSVISNLPITDRRLENIRDETRKDETMQLLKNLTIDGWPKKRTMVRDDAKPYFNIREDLNVVNDLLLKGSRIVIPKSLIQEMKTALHTGHLGIERTKSNARETLYWPGIDSDITDMVESCNTCQKYRHKQQKETLIPHDTPLRAWTKVGTDIFSCLNRNYILVIDYTSKYFDLHQLPNLCSSTVIHKTKSIFARYGIPEIVISDNGTQFSSYKYKQFSKDWNFKHVTSSPEFPQSNGLVERAIQTIKKTMKKCSEDRSDPYLALLALRTTKNSTNSSPDEILMNRKLRTILPRIDKTHVTEKEKILQEHKMKMNSQLKSYYDQNSRDIPPLQQGETVRYQENGRWQRLGKVIDKHHQQRSYNIVNDNGNIIRRNRQHLIPSKERFVIKSDDDNDISDNSTNKQNEHDFQQYDRQSSEDTSDDDEIEQTQPNLDEPESMYRTRSGRAIRKPERYR